MIWRMQRPSDALIPAAAPLMAIALIWMNRGGRPWWVGVGLFGISVLLISAFLGAGYARLYRSHGPWSVRALLHVGAAALGLVMGVLSVWLAAVDLIAGQLGDFAVGVSRLLGTLGLAFLALGAIALFSDALQAPSSPKR